MDCRKYKAGNFPNFFLCKKKKLNQIFISSFSHINIKVLIKIEKMSVSWSQRWMGAFVH